MANRDYTATVVAGEAFRKLVALGDEGTFTDADVLDVVRGIGYDAFRVLDERPGQWSPPYHHVDAWRALRCLRNDRDVPLFDILNEGTK